MGPSVRSILAIFSPLREDARVADGSEDDAILFWVWF